MDSDRAKAACSTIISLAQGSLDSGKMQQIEKSLEEIEDYFGEGEEAPNGKLAKLTHEEKKVFQKETMLEPDTLKAYIRRKKKRSTGLERVAYTLYSSNKYGKLANRFFEGFSEKISKAYPAGFKPLYNALRSSGIKVLSQTYISMILFSALLAFILITPIVILLWSHPSIIVRIMRGPLMGILGAGIVGAVFYAYPFSVAKTRESAIKQDLPFVITHMAAVAGSGGKPISIFTTILSSDEYQGIRDEIKKIVNYVNLFGYDLSTALRAVGRRTPSQKFKDLLDGIVNTLESGGDLKDYLEAMADEALNTYRLERKKAVESIETYSDIYTTVCIAAPLLFFVTLAIIQTMGGQIGGADVGTIAFFGTYIGLPFVNIGYLIFLSVVQPK